MLFEAPAVDEADLEPYDYPMADLGPRQVDICVELCGVSYTNVVSSLCCGAVAPTRRPRRVGRETEILGKVINTFAASLFCRLRRLGLDKLIASARSRQRNLVMGMIAARTHEPKSKLETTRWWHPAQLAAALPMLKRRFIVGAGLAAVMLAQGKLSLSSARLAVLHARAALPLAKGVLPLSSG